MKPQNATSTIEIRTDIEDGSDELSVTIHIDAPRGSMGPLGLFADAASFVLSNHDAPEREHIAALDVMRSSSSAFARARGIMVPELPRELALDNAGDNEPSDTIRPDSAKKSNFGSMLSFANAIDRKDADAAGVALGLLLGTLEPNFAIALEDALYNELDARIRAKPNAPKPDATGYLSETGGGVSVANGSRVIAAGVGTRPDDADEGTSTNDENDSQTDNVIEEPYLEPSEDERTPDEIIDEIAAPVVGFDPQADVDPDVCDECKSTTDDPYSDKVVSMQIEKLLRTSGEVLEPSAIRGQITARRDCGAMLSFARIDRLLGDLCERRIVRAVDDGYRWENPDAVADPHTANDESANIALEGDAHPTPPAPEPSPIDIRTAIVRLVRARAQTADKSATIELEKCADEISNGAHMTKHPDYSEERAANEFLMSRGYARLGKVREAFLLVVSELSSPGKLEALVSEVVAPKPAEAIREIIPNCHLCGKDAAAICNACGIRFCYEKSCMDRHENSFEHITATTSNENNYACNCKKGKKDDDCPRHVRRFVYAERAETAPRILSESDAPSKPKRNGTKDNAFEFAVEWHESGVLVWRGKDIPVIPGDIDDVKGKAVRVVIYGTAPRSDDGGTISDLRKWIMQKGAASVEMVDGGTSGKPAKKRYAAIVIGCSAQKNTAAGEMPARELYTSHLFRLSLAWAEAVADRVYIASAFFDLIRPDTDVFKYERKLSDLGGVKFVDAWGSRCASKLISGETPENPYLERIAFLCGKEYAEPIIANLSRKVGQSIEQPLEGLAIGARKVWLIENLRNCGIDPRDLDGSPDDTEPPSSSRKGDKGASAPASSSSTSKPASTSGKAAKDETPAATVPSKDERTAIVEYIWKRAETLPTDVSSTMISIASRIEAGVHIEPGEDERRAAVAYIRLRGGAKGGAFGAAAIDAANAIERGAHIATNHVPLPLFDEPTSSNRKGGKGASAPASSSSTSKPASTNGKAAKDETPAATTTNKGGRPKRGIEPELLAAIVKHATSVGKDGAKMGDFEKAITGFSRNDIERGVDALTIDGAITGIGNAKARKYFLSSVLS